MKVTPRMASLQAHFLHTKVTTQRFWLLAWGEKQQQTTPLSKKLHPLYLGKQLQAPHMSMCPITYPTTKKILVASSSLVLELKLKVCESYTV